MNVSLFLCISAYHNVFSLISSIMQYQALIIQTTAPDLLFAKRLAHILVEEHLAACVHIAHPGLSLYMWQDNLEGSEELSLTIKTSTSMAQACMDKIRELHPYDLPEIICLPIIGGHADYLNWINKQTQPSAEC